MPPTIYPSPLSQIVQYDTAFADNLREELDNLVSQGIACPNAQGLPGTPGVLVTSRARNLSEYISYNTPTSNAEYYSGGSTVTPLETTSGQYGVPIYNNGVVTTDMSSTVQVSPPAPLRDLNAFEERVLLDVGFLKRQFERDGIDPSSSIGVAKTIRALYPTLFGVDVSIMDSRRNGNAVTIELDDYSYLITKC